MIGESKKNLIIHWEYEVMNREELKQFTIKLFQAWEARDHDTIASMYKKDIVAHINDTSVGYNDIMNRVEFTKKHFKKMTNVIKDLMIDGDKVIVRVEQTCVGEESEHIYKIIAIYHVKDYKVIEMWASFQPTIDYLSPLISK